MLRQYCSVCIWRKGFGVDRIDKDEDGELSSSLILMSVDKETSEIIAQELNRAYQLGREDRLVEISEWGKV